MFVCLLLCCILINNLLWLNLLATCVSSQPDTLFSFTTNFPTRRNCTFSDCFGNWRRIQYRSSSCTAWYHRNSKTEITNSKSKTVLKGNSDGDRLLHEQTIAVQRSKEKALQYSQHLNNKLKGSTSDNVNDLEILSAS